MDIENLISSPSKFFKNPGEVIDSKELNKKQKIKALENWKQTCIQLQESTTEGMLGKGQENLKDVSNALRTLQSTEKSKEKNN